MPGSRETCETHISGPSGRGVLAADDPHDEGRVDQVTVLVERHRAHRRLEAVREHDDVAQSLSTDDGGHALVDLVQRVAAGDQLVELEPPAPVQREQVRDVDVPDQASWLQRVADAPEAEQEQLLLDLLRTHAAAVLGHGSPELIEVEHSLLELGFSSFTALELSNRLKTEAGLLLPPVAIYGHPTPIALARYLRTELTSTPAG